MKGKNQKQEDSDFKSNGEKVINVESVPETEAKDDKNLNDLIQEMDSSMNKKLEENFQEKDLNKIKANIFKKDKINKDKATPNNNTNEKVKGKFDNKKNNNSNSIKNIKF